MKHTSKLFTSICLYMFVCIFFYLFRFTQYVSIVYILTLFISIHTITFVTLINTTKQYGYHYFVLPRLRTLSFRAIDPTIPRQRQKTCRLDTLKNNRAQSKNSSREPLNLNRPQQPRRGRRPAR